MLFTNDDRIPKTFASNLESIQNQLQGLDLNKMLDKLSRSLGGLPDEDTLPDAYSDSDVEVMDGEEELEEEEEDGDYDEDEYYEDDEVWSPQSPQEEEKGNTGPAPVLSISSTQKSQIRADLLRVKKTGFKVGLIGNVLGGEANVYVAISIRVSKLGISDEALQAWSVDRRRYLVLLVYYAQGYRDITQMSQDDRVGRSGVEMRVGLCHLYKPSRAAAVQAFTKTVKSVTSSIAPKEYKEEPIKEEHKFNPMFLSRSLKDLLNERLFKILRYRLTLGFGWGGAELYYNEHQCKALDHDDVIDAKYYEEDESSSSISLPVFVNADHLTQAQDKASFPLVAMQFVLRHFVRCTEFCLVCHCKVKADFEALKPYVCDNGLCLYQYMSLGFGPSIEWEIMSQPYVVDLLVSFCYASAKAHRLKDFPKGLNLQVPPLTAALEIDTANTRYTMMTGTSKQTSSPVSAFEGTEVDMLSWTETRLRAKFYPRDQELLFSDTTAKSPLEDGDWIIIQDPLHGTQEIHCRVMEAHLYPTIKVGNLNVRGSNANGLGLLASLGGAGPNPIDVWLNKYDRNFDGFSEQAKRQSICQILDTLPDVREMKSYLLQSQLDRSEPSLPHWKERISGTALNLLRWIIASNRSCLLQVDDIGGTESDAQYVTSSKAENRVYGMGQWMQFRFAQGAPDKEQRFIDAVKSTTQRLNLKYPTIFAWHGSPIGNWHGIVREGLHFNEALHGRAFGNGVYMSNNYHTSVGYCIPYHAPDVAPNWPHSKLKISQAIALNEVVNAPKEFVSQSPHYVVHHLDWIQTRYLFVQCTATDKPLLPEVEPVEQFPQDPTRLVVGERHTPVIIPITAVSKSRRTTTTTSPRPSQGGRKRMKVEIEIDGMTQGMEDDRESVATNASDLGALFASDEEEDIFEIPKAEFEQHKKNGKNPASQTDFVENSLEITTLPMLAPPSYANPVATKALQRCLRETLVAQGSTPLDELGWYINPDHVNNLYQWIVELHSFDPKLPLSTDMKKENLKSIVLELRFPSSFPYAPPFVRVIRPRFLSFAQGGGGHVTAGGALCMELLTSSGWSAANNIESVLLQVRMAISSTDPKPARLANYGMRDYGIGEAMEAYIRACRMHGWQVPSDFTTFGREMQAVGSNDSGDSSISGTGLTVLGTGGYI
jgi:ubiquitin-conjugating enzyme E2 Q